MAIFGFFEFVVPDSPMAATRVVGHLVVIAGIFVSGFCYRERLRQLNRRPGWPFRSMVEDR